MSSIKIDSSNDIQLVNNDLQLIEGRDEIAQILKQNLRVFFSEWFLDRTIGILYFEEILKKNPNPATIDAIFKNAILESPGVIELVEYSLELENRSLILSFRARTLEGIISFNEVLL